MLNDYSRDQLDRSSNDYLDRDDLGASGPGIYYALAGLLVICAAAGGSAAALRVRHTVRLREATPGPRALFIPNSKGWRDRIDEG